MFKLSIEPWDQVKNIEISTIYATIRLKEEDDYVEYSHDEYGRRDAAMKKRGDACGCIQRFLSHFPALRITQMAGLRYEDDVCVVECDGHVIKAYSYEIISGTRRRIGECVMSIW